MITPIEIDTPDGPFRGEYFVPADDSHVIEVRSQDGRSKRAWIVSDGRNLDGLARIVLRELWQQGR